MDNSLVPETATELEAHPAFSRRKALKVAAWSVPVVAVAVTTPLASASPVTGSDIVLSFDDITEGSTRDITFAVIDFIERTIRSLGPQRPVEPELVLPPEPPRPPGNPFTNPGGWAEYSRAYVQWLLDVAAANAGHAQLVAEYLRALGEYLVWDTAVRAIVARLRDVALQSEGLFFASATYPRTLRVHNNGPETIAAGTIVTVQLSVDSNLINAHLPQTGPIQILQTGGTSTLTYVLPADEPAGAEIFSQPLVYNPASVTLNIGGFVEQSSITGILAPSNQDTDINDNGDLVTSPIGIRLDVATGDVQAILNEWTSLVQQLIDFYELISPLLPEIDWREIISGRLELPALN